jgi:hypothetical protein
MEEKKTVRFYFQIGRKKNGFGLECRGRFFLNMTSPLGVNFDLQVAVRWARQKQLPNG